MDKIGKAFGAGIVFFSIVVAGFVGSKVDQTTIALLGGTFIGLLVAVPTTLLVVLIARRRSDEHTQQLQQERGQRYVAHMPPSPPQYWAMPQQGYDMRVMPPPTMQQMQPHYPQLNSGIAAPDYMLPLSRRRFYMIGEGGEVKEIEAPHDAGYEGFDQSGF